MKQGTCFRRMAGLSLTMACLSLWLAPATLTAGESETAVDLNSIPTNDAGEKLRLQVTIARENDNPLFLTMPGPLNDLRLKLAIKNTSDPLTPTGSGSPSPSLDFDFGTPMTLKLKPGHHLRELATPGVNPEDVLEIKPGHTIEVVEKPVLSQEVAKNADAVKAYRNADGSVVIPTYKSYEALTANIKNAADDTQLRAALKQFADDAGLTFEPMGANMEERANLITTLPQPELGADSRVEVYVYRKTTPAEQAAYKEMYPEKTPPPMLRVPRANHNLFATGQSSGATQVVDSGKEIAETIDQTTPFVVDVGRNFQFAREGDYVVVASILGRRANISNQIEFKVLPYWRTNITLEKLDQWVNHNRSLGPFPYDRMVYLVESSGGFRELVYSKRYANGKIMHHEFFRLGKVHPEHENEIQINVLDANVLKVIFTESHGQKCIAQIDFSYSSPNTSLNLIP